MSNEKPAPLIDNKPVQADETHLEPSPLWTVDEVAAYLRLTPDTVRAMVRRKKLPCIRIGRVIRFDSEAIRQWVVNQQKPVDDLALTS